MPRQTPPSTYPLHGFSDDAGTVIAIEEDPYLWARITGAQNGRYSWVEVRPLAPTPLWESLTITVMLGSGTLGAEEGDVNEVPAVVTPGHTVALEITGTWDGTISFEGSEDGTTWVPLLATNSDASTTSNGTWTFTIPTTIQIVRASFSFFTSGEAAVAWTVADQPENGSGTFLLNPAIEVNGNDDVPVGVVVQLWRGFWDESYDWDYRFIFTGANGPLFVRMTQDQVPVTHAEYVAGVNAIVQVWGIAGWEDSAPPVFIEATCIDHLPLRKNDKFWVIYHGGSTGTTAGAGDGGDGGVAVQTGGADDGGFCQYCFNHPSKISFSSNEFTGCFDVVNGPWTLTPGDDGCQYTATRETHEQEVFTTLYAYLALAPSGLLHFEFTSTAWTPGCKMVVEYQFSIPNGNCCDPIIATRTFFDCDVSNIGGCGNFSGNPADPYASSTAPLNLTLNPDCGADSNIEADEDVIAATAGTGHWVPTYEPRNAPIRVTASIIDAAGLLPGVVKWLNDATMAWLDGIPCRVLDANSPSLPMLAPGVYTGCDLVGHRGGFAIYACSCCPGTVIPGSGSGPSGSSGSGAVSTGDCITDYCGPCVPLSMPRVWYLDAPMAAAGLCDPFAGGHTLVYRGACDWATDYITDQTAQGGNVGPTWLVTLDPFDWQWHLYAAGTDVGVVGSQPEACGGTISFDIEGWNWGAGYSCNTDGNPITLLPGNLCPSPFPGVSGTPVPGSGTCSQICVYCPAVPYLFLVHLRGFGGGTVLPGALPCPSACLGGTPTTWAFTLEDLTDCFAVFNGDYVLTPNTSCNWQFVNDSPAGGGLRLSADLSVFVGGAILTLAYDYDEAGTDRTILQYTFVQSPIDCCLPIDVEWALEECSITDPTPGDRPDSITLTPSCATPLPSPCSAFNVGDVYLTYIDTSATDNYCTWGYTSATLKLRWLYNGLRWELHGQTLVNGVVTCRFDYFGEIDQNCCGQHVVNLFQADGNAPPSLTIYPASACDNCPASGSGSSGGSGSGVIVGSCVTDICSPCGSGTLSSTYTLTAPGLAFAPNGCDALGNTPYTLTYAGIINGNCTWQADITVDLTADGGSIGPAWELILNSSTRAWDLNAAGTNTGLAAVSACTLPQCSGVTPQSYSFSISGFTGCYEQFNGTWTLHHTPGSCDYSYVEANPAGGGDLLGIMLVSSQGYVGGVLHTYLQLAFILSYNIGTPTAAATAAGYFLDLPGSFDCCDDLDFAVGGDSYAYCAADQITLADTVPAAITLVPDCITPPLVCSDAITFPAGSWVPCNNLAPIEITPDNICPVPSSGSSGSSGSGSSGSGSSGSGSSGSTCGCPECDGDMAQQFMTVINPILVSDNECADCANIASTHYLDYYQYCEWRENPGFLFCGDPNAYYRLYYDYDSLDWILAVVANGVETFRWTMILFDCGAFGGISFEFRDQIGTACNVAEGATGNLYGVEEEGLVVCP